MNTRAQNTADDIDITLNDTLVPVATLLGGVPLLTLLVMTAVRYVGTGSF